MVTQKQYYNELVKFIKTFVHQPNNFGWDGIESACKYKAPNGKKCAIGQYIPNEKYKPTMEGQGVGDWVAQFLPFYNLDFWGRLQALHDGMASNNYPIRGSTAIDRILLAANKFCPDYTKKLIGLYYAW